MLEDAKDLFERFHNFDDGLVLSFQYLYPENEPLTARIIFYSKNHSAFENTWNEVAVTISEVEKLHAIVNGNQFNSICSGVKLIKFGDLWCVDIDGNYPFAEDPKSIDDVYRYGDCYVIGRHVNAEIIK
jgi:hypothetical protein